MKKNRRTNQPGSGKQERYIQPSILLGLQLRPSYGYELIHNIKDFGFVEGQAPPGMIYRHLRQLEEDGLVVSEWKTEGTGPAKRIYSLTENGSEVLALWIDHMYAMAEKLQNFIEIYQRINGKEQR